MFIYSLIRNGASVPEILICLLSLVLAAGIAIIVHEIAHGFVALKCGDPTAKMANRLTLNPVVHFDLLGLILIVLVGFGWAKPVPVNPNNFKNYKKGMILVSSAGVISNILMCGLGLLLLWLLYPLFGSYVNQTVYVFQLFGYYVLSLFISINFMLAFFNLLPIYPLDGFRLLDVFLKPGNAYSRFMYHYGGYCILALVLLGNVFRAVNLDYLDIFSLVNSLITKLIGLVIS